MTSKKLAESLIDGLVVSRETLDKLTHYQALLEKWNRSINLVARSTIQDAWDRHILDSAQLMLPARAGAHWLDIGSGAGFPGLVCAIISAETHPDRKFTLLEADQRKTEFLRSVSRETSTPVTVIAERIERQAPLGADIISARALAPLKHLLAHVERHGAPGATALLLKGRTHRDEVEEALAQWRFQTQIRPSRTQEDAVVLEISEVERAE